METCKGSCGDQTGIPSLTVDDAEIRNDLEKACCFNQFSDDVEKACSDMPGLRNHFNVVRYSSTGT